jgi:hypothetical protein
MHDKSFHRSENITLATIRVLLYKVDRPESSSGTGLRCKIAERWSSEGG